MLYIAFEGDDSAIQWCQFCVPLSGSLVNIFRVPVSVRHVAIGESNQELAKRNLCIVANLAKSIK